jgi:outer membrane immunogenic protein
VGERILTGAPIKHSVIGIAAVASLLTTSALAADMAAPVYTKAPVIPVVVYDWTGFYIGGNIGYSWDRSSTTQSFYDGPTGTTLLSSYPSSFNLDGVIGGGQIGYNWQRDRWVFGLEADIQGSAEKGSTSAVCPGGSATATTLAGLSGVCAVGHIGDTAPFNVAAFPVINNLSESIQWFGTVRGRIGPTITPTILLYVTGGLAYGQVNASDTVTGVNITGPQGVNGSTSTAAAAAFSSNSTRVGWTAGAGIEGTIGGGWTPKLEYLYIDLGSILGSFVTPIVSPSGNFVFANYNSHVTDNILRVGVNYRFGTAPVVAKY